MTSFWKVDSCDCELEYSQGGNLRVNFINSIVNCKLHVGLVGLAHHDAVIAHNQSFNLNTGGLTLPTDFPSMVSHEESLKLAITLNNGQAIAFFTRKIKIINDKQDEKARIRNLP